MVVCTAQGSDELTQMRTQTTWFVQHAAQSQPTPYLMPLSVRQQNAVGMAFRLRADSDQGPELQCLLKVKEDLS